MEYNNLTKWLKNEWFKLTIIIIILLVLLLLGIRQKWDRQESISQSEKSDVLMVYNQVKGALPKHSLYCIPETKSYCTIDGCIADKPNVFVIIGQSPEGEAFLGRCDSKPCDIYPSNLEESGEVVTVTTKEPHGMLFKSSYLDSSYVEVVTLLTDAFISTGQCYKNENS